MTIAKIGGSTSKVTTVDMTSPPITARPSGISIWLPCSNPSTIGTMPTVIAKAVVRIGRRRWPAATTAASVAAAPFCQCSFMKVTSNTELDTETPRHMIVPSTIRCSMSFPP